MSSFTAQIPVASLFQDVEFTVLRSLPGWSMDDQVIDRVTVDSREVTADSLFVAVPGVVNDGHDFMEAAVAAGCRVVVCSSGRGDSERAKSLQATVIEVEDTVKAYAVFAANYFQRPADALRLIGVTGTNGKTTVTYLVEHVLLQAGFSVGVIGTVNNRYTGKSGDTKILDSPFTTPEAFLLQKVLREMVDNGVTHVLMEVSSHGLAQSRIGTLVFDAAAFTNLSRDHLDYHADMDDYFQVKTVLFSDHMRPGATAVLPGCREEEDENGWLRQLHGICARRGYKLLCWGEGANVNIRLVRFTSSLVRTELVLQTPSGERTLLSPLVGRYNIDNVLTAYGLCLAAGIKETIICRALATATGAPGRVERVDPGCGWESEGPVVLVDYAHTPDALEKVLHTVAALPHGDLFCVFGCGGDRDVGKRPLMGQIAGKGCDVVVVTDDNPRTEDPDQIIAQILDGVNDSPLEMKNEEWLLTRKDKECGCVVVRERKKAIDAAIRAAFPGDIVVIAGKGHEPYQLTRQGKRFFDDRQEARRVLFSWTTDLIAAAVKGRVHSGKKKRALLGPIITDSRVGSRDGIFVALKGENHDAHDYAAQAVANGASCLVVEKKIALSEKAAVDQVEVEDTLQALGDLAAFRRQRLAEQCRQVVIGLTGSCGKTTVKEMVFAILTRMWPEGGECPADCVLKTAGNYNNLIGLPLSLLPLDVSHRAAVLEMGMNRPGELTRLGTIADPDISCITNIHGAHLEGLQSIEGVARAKEELFGATRESGVLIVNLDDARIRKLSRNYNHRQITFAVQREADLADSAEKPQRRPDLWASNIHMGDGGTISFTLHHGQERVAVSLCIAGEHNVANALCAAAISTAAGAGLEHIAAGLGDFRPPDKRMEMVCAKSGFTIINDTYNANPASMAAGLKTLKMVARRFSVCLLGDMRELGEASRRAHYDIGKLIADLAPDYVGVVGEFKEDVVQGALEHSFDESRIHMFAEKEDAVRWMKEIVDCAGLGQDDVVLVKASRGLCFETIVAKLVDL